MNKTRGITLSDFKLYSILVVIKTLWYCKKKNRHIVEQNSEFRGKHRYVYSIYDKETKNKYTLGKVLGKLNSHMQNNETRLLSIHKS